MADSKLSQLTELDALSGNALLYVSDNKRDRSISAENLFASIPNTRLNGKIQFSDDAQIMTTGGVVDLTVPITDLHIDLDSHNITIPIPEDGINQLKVIVVSQFSGGSFTLAGNIINSGNVVFENKGDSATLMFYSGANRWILL